MTQNNFGPFGQAGPLDDFMDMLHQGSHQMGPGGRPPFPIDQVQGGSPFTPPSQSHGGGSPFTPPSQSHGGGSPFTPPSQSHGGGSPFTPPGQSHGGESPFTPPGQSHGGGPPFTPPGQSHGGGSPFTPPGQSHGGGPPFNPPGQGGIGGPPPFTPPDYDSGDFGTGGSSVYAVDPGSFHGCLRRLTRVRLTNGVRFWFYPTFIGRTSVAGYRWYSQNQRWRYSGFDTNSVASFNCY